MDKDRSKLLESVTEKDFQANVVDMARLLNWKVYHTFDSRRSPEGYPDLTLVKGFRLIFAELKSMKGRLTDQQELWWDALALVSYRSENVQVFVWRPSDWNQIEEVLGA